MKSLFATTVVALAALANAFIAANTAYKPIAFGPGTGTLPDEEEDQPADHEAETKKKKKKAKEPELVEGFTITLVAYDHGRSGVTSVTLVAGFPSELEGVAPIGELSYVNQEGGSIYAIYTR
jgi:hypothetical protein